MPGNNSLSMGSKSPRDDAARKWQESNIGGRILVIQEEIIGDMERSSTEHDGEDDERVESGNEDDEDGDGDETAEDLVVGEGAAKEGDRAGD
ncbi:hypothetical protein ACLOJK_012466 [Asimina triloba]